MDLTSLKRLAEAATPGPWEAYTDCPGKCCWLIRQPAQDDGDFTDEGVTWPECSEEDARYIAALSPDKLLKLIAVVEAAKRYYECYAQDEADDGDYAMQGMPGHNTGCSYEQAVDAKALRSALKELDK